MKHVDFMRAKDREMPVPLEPELVGSAKFWDCRYDTFESLKELTRLHTLEIMTFPDASLDVVGHLTQLRYLRIIHLPNVELLDPLANLVDLEILGLETLPSWDSSGKVTEVHSLDPLGELQKLRYVQLFGVRPVDQSLGALERCAALESARFSKYPKKEIDRFYAATGVAVGHIPEPRFEAG